MITIRLLVCVLFLLVVYIQQAKAGCTTLPATLPAAAALPNITELPNPFKWYDGTSLTTKSDWTCRRNQLSQMLQYYEYGFYPPAPTSVTGVRSGNTLTVTVVVETRKATITASIALPSGSGPFPVFINAGGLPTSFTSRGYALLTLSLGSIASDSATKSGAFWSLYPGNNTGVLLAWAWGYHRVIDALVGGAIPEIDAKRVAVTGHSRYGKAALCATAFDERVALGVPMSSGTSGVGPYRFFYEDNGAAEHLSNAFGYAPWWYTPTLGTFVSLEGHLPFDQHSLIALGAPRPLLITEGTEDYWTNPEGTSVTYRAAKVVYNWLGVANNLGISYRSGSHAPTADDWAAVLDFADWKLQGKTVTRNFDNSTFPAHPATYPWSAPSANQINLN